MSVEVTRLASGLSVVTDRMPHLESASLGVWIGAGSRDEAPDEHGISHLLEHMAFKGTKRRTARQIAEEIEAVGGDLNAGTSVESTAYYARVLKADVPLALDVLSDILSEPTFDRGGIAARAERDRAGDRRHRRRARRSGVRPFAGNRFPEAAGRPLHSGHAGDRALVRSGAAARLSHAQLPRPRHDRGRRRRGRACGDRRRGREALCKLRRAGRAGAGARAFPRRQPGRDPRSRAGAHRACAARRAGARRPAATACRCSPMCWAAACPRACSRKCARSAGSATPSTPSTCPIPTPACSRSMPAPTKPTRPN